MRWSIFERRFRKLWPRVDPTWIINSVAHRRTQDREGVDALLARADALPGPDAASLLVPLVASTMETIERGDQVHVIDALDALIRAGGDPGPARGVFLQGLGDRSMDGSTCRALRRAALSGWSIVAFEAALARVSERARWLADARRLAALQREGRIAEIHALNSVYDNQPVANLFDGIRLVAQQLLDDSAEAVELASATLVQLQRAGDDLWRCWCVMIPVLRHQLRLRDPERCVAAARVLQQAPRMVERSGARSPEQAVRQVSSVVEPTLSELLALARVDDSYAATAAAEAAFACVEAGFSLARARGAAERVLDHEQLWVRVACSRALSRHLRRVGEEPALPEGFSHRRTYARSDAPLAGKRAGSCGRCDAVSRFVIYEHTDRRQFSEDSVIESRCTACGVYRVAQFGYCL